MLRPLLGVGEEFDRQFRILGGGCAALARARNRPQRRHPILQPHMYLGRRANHLKIEFGEIEVKHVGGGVEHSQGAINGEGMGTRFAAKPLAENDLEDVPGGDVFFGRPHHRFVFFLPLVGEQLPIKAVLPAGVSLAGDAGQRPQQLLGHLLNFLDGVHIGGGDGLWVATPRHPCVGNDEQDVAGMVEDDEGVAQEKDGFGDGQAGHGRFGQFLELAHDIVA